MSTFVDIRDIAELSEPPTCQRCRRRLVDATKPCPGCGWTGPRKPHDVRIAAPSIKRRADGRLQNHC